MLPTGLPQTQSRVMTSVGARHAVPLRESFTIRRLDRSGETMRLPVAHAAEDPPDTVDEGVYVGVGVGG